jgi:hypothetical protein
MSAVSEFTHSPNAFFAVLNNDMPETNVAAGKIKLIPLLH